MLRKSQTSKNEPQPVKEPVSSNIPAKSQVTIIGEHISIQGDIKGKEDLLIEGNVKGSVHLPQHHLTVGEKGQVEASIHAAQVTISGTLKGNIMATGKVEITKDADFTGEIKAGRISVEDGAYLKAVIELKKEGKPAITPKTINNDAKLGVAPLDRAQGKK